MIQNKIITPKQYEEGLEIFNGAGKPPIRIGWLTSYKLEDGNYAVSYDDGIYPEHA